MASVEERLQRLEDQIAIYQTVCGYGYAVDGLNVEVFLFEREGVNWAVFDVSGAGGAEAEAKALADKVSRWSYAIPAVKANALRTKLTDLVEPPKPS